MIMFIWHKKKAWWVNMDNKWQGELEINSKHTILLIQNAIQYSSDPRSFVYCQLRQKIRVHTHVSALGYPKRKVKWHNLLLQPPWKHQSLGDLTSEENFTTNMDTTEDWGLTFLSDVAVTSCCTLCITCMSARIR